MTHLNDENLFKRIDQLIRLKATGNSRQLSNKLSISLSHTYRILEKMKEEGGCPIVYCRETNSFIYQTEGKLIINFKFEKVEEGKMSKLKGGLKLFFSKNEN